MAFSIFSCSSLFSCSAFFCNASWKYTGLLCLASFFARSAPLGALVKLLSEFDALRAGAAGDESLGGALSGGTGVGVAAALLGESAIDVAVASSATGPWGAGKATPTGPAWVVENYVKW
mmetsp:Transcript_80058/g.214297  ORF Transcript_80058/g.214297 Transcript_80058/m.214297 type:complete len:119 (-) Transcript_80058:686-1042(-)